MDGDIFQIPVPFHLPPTHGPTAHRIIVVNIQSDEPWAHHQQAVRDNSHESVATEDLMETVYPSPPSSDRRVSRPTYHSTIAEIGRRRAHIFFGGQDRPRTYEFNNDPRTLPSIHALLAHAFNQTLVNLPTDTPIPYSTVAYTSYPVPANTARRQRIRHIFNVKAWSWASVVVTGTFLSTILSFALLTASYVARWSSPAQKSLLFWFVLSVVMFLGTMILLSGLSGKLAKVVERVRICYRGAEMNGSQREGEEEESELQNLEMGGAPVATQHPPNTPVSVYFRFPSRSSDERSNDCDRTGSNRQTGRDEILHKSTTSRERSTSQSDSDTSLHPGFAETDRSNLLQYPNRPISRVNIARSQTQYLGKPISRQADHKRTRHPTLSISHDTTFAGLLAEEKLRQKSAERQRQGQQQEKRIEAQPAVSRGFYRPDTPRPADSTSNAASTPTQLIVHRSRGLPLRVSNPPLIETSPSTPSACFSSSPPVTSKAISQHEARLPTSHTKEYQLITPCKNKRFPPPPRRTSITSNPSPPSSDAGTVIHYTAAQMEGEACARAVKMEIEAEAQAKRQRQLEAERTWLEQRKTLREEKDKPRKASESVLRIGTPSTLVELDRHLRNSGALELNAYLDRHEEIHKASELSFTRSADPAKECAVTASPSCKLALDAHRAYLDRHEKDIHMAPEQCFVRATEPASDQIVVTPPKRKLIFDTAGAASSVASSYHEDQRQTKRRKEERHGKVRRSQGYVQLPSLTTSTASSDCYTRRDSTDGHRGVLSTTGQSDAHGPCADTFSRDAHLPHSPVTAIGDPLMGPVTLPSRFISPLIPESSGLRIDAANPLRARDTNKNKATKTINGVKSKERAFVQRRQMFIGGEVGPSDAEETRTTRGGKPDGKENVPPNGTGYPGGAG